MKTYSRAVASDHRPKIAHAIFNIWLTRAGFSFLLVPGLSSESRALAIVDNIGDLFARPGDRLWVEGV
jgi:hypothetical protein